jgi:hypothetical protein
VFSPLIGVVGYSFVGVDRDQPFLLPPSLSDWLPADRLAWFILDAGLRPIAWCTAHLVTASF